MRKIRNWISILIVVLASVPALSAQEWYRQMNPGDMQIVSVTVDPADTRVEGNYIVWEPGRNRRASVYETIYIVADTFSIWYQVAPQDWTGEPYDVDLSIVMISPTTYTPGNPDEAAPEGGVQIERYIGIIEAAR